MSNLISYFLNNGIIYELQTEQGSAHTKKMLVAVFGVLKMVGIVD
jgi:hypothetical protein